MKLEQAKKVSLGVFPTPLQYMENLTNHLGTGKLYIKRDDMTDVGMSGNKIRKLEYIVYDARQNGCTTLLTFGGAQSNHARLTAAVAAKCGMKCILMLSGERPDYCSGNLALDEMFGADVYFLGGKFMEPDADEAAKVAGVVREYESRGEKVYQVPVGGDTEIAAAGYITMVKELMEQMERQRINARYVVTTVGSSGTFAGLWIGAKYYNAPFEVIGVSIVPPVLYNIDYSVEHINKYCEFYDLDFRCKPEDLHIIFNRYVRNGYNIPDEVTSRAIRLLAAKEGIVADPVYTGKMFGGLLDLLESGEIPRGENVIMLHTGGIPAVWTKEHLDAVQAEIWGAGHGKKLYA